ncbi:MAG: hypothetical protein ABFC34_05295, partial [Methanobacterium sp.]
ITFTAPYNSLTSEQILTIWNLPKQIKIYDSQNPKNYTLFIPDTERTQDFDIEIIDGILSYVTTTGMNIGDQLKIEYDANINYSVTVINNVSVAAGATNNPVVVPLEDSLNQILIYPENTGNSTNLTINIYSSPDSDGETKASLQPVTLDNTDDGKCAEIPVNNVPKNLVFVAINNDEVNATTYRVKISKRV